MANYYFLATLLPPLRVGSPVELSSAELQFLLEQNLTPSDMELVRVLKRLIDIDNIRAIWKKQPYTPGGNIDYNELEELLVFKEGLPEYVLEFLDSYQEKKELIENFPKILHSYFAKESTNKNGFLKRYITFQWQWKLVFTALRAHELGRDIEKELAAADNENPFLEELLDASKEKQFEPPAPYTGLKELFDSRKTAPLDLYQALSEWRFDYIEEMIEWENFSIERILGYVAQLEICEEWLQLDKLKGLEIVEEIMEIV
ncbi:MAG: DUF2764 family protein [Verrucomicrobia bacterium]|nr:DUF2764 family protein [Verrucomicrobiota bacterium]